VTNIPNGPSNLPILGVHVRMCIIMTATSGNWNWSIWTSGGLAKCEIQFQSRRYESQVNKCALPDQSNVPNGPLTNQLPDAALSTRMCTIMGAIGNNQPYLILFRNWPANGKIHFQTRRSHETQSALTIPIDLLHMPGHSTKCFSPMSIC
jgi:hypothetical protein